MKIINLKLKIGLLIGLFVYLFIGSISARAGALSLSLDPSIITINAVPPTTAMSNLTIQNKSDDQVQLIIQLKPFRANLENGELEYLKEASLIFKNIQIMDTGVPVASITLAPRQQKTLDLNINIPQDTNISARPPATSSNQSMNNQASVAGEAKYRTVPGEVGPARQSNAQALAGGRDYYFSIIFISQNSYSPQSNASLNQIGIATNVLLSVGPKETPKAVLEEFSSGLFYESGPVPFTVRVKNKGIHFIKPKGDIIIKNMFGQSIGKLDLMSVNILSDSIRAIPNALYVQELRSQDNLSPYAKFTLDFKRPIVLWKEHFLLGFYTATLNIYLFADGPSFTKSIHFFAFPFQGMIVIVFVLISTIIIVNRVRSRMKK